MVKEMDEQELARNCSLRDRKAEDELYRRYAVRVNALCRRYVESLNQVLDRIDSYKYSGKGSLYGWISRIAINKSIDQIRRRRWRTIPLDLWARDNIPEPTEDEMETIPKEKLREWISELSDLRRAVFNMYCIDNYSHQEIAQMLGITETGSTSILAKARKQLKDKIKRYLKVQGK